MDWYKLGIIAYGLTITIPLVQWWLRVRDE